MFACVAACLTTGAAVGQTPATMPPPAISSPPPAPATPHYNLGLPMFAAGADPYNLSSATTAPAPQATAATSQTALSNEYTFDTFRPQIHGYVSAGVATGSCRLFRVASAQRSDTTRITHRCICIPLIMSMLISAWSAGILVCRRL
jgi:hypothetical protein